jgi:hypothetical protein
MLRMSVLNFALGLFFVATGASSEEHPHNHVRHGMFLYGEEEVYASHIIYKVPHNYQVILKIELDAGAREVYLAARGNHPDHEIVYVLHPSDISKIQSAEFIVGDIVVRDSSGGSTTLLTDVRLEKAQFSILFFNELPLILGNQSQTHHGVRLGHRLER